MLLHGVQVTDFSGNSISNSAVVKIEHTVGEPVTKILDNTFINTSKVEIEELYSDKENTAILSNNVYQTQP